MISFTITIGLIFFAEMGSYVSYTQSRFHNLSVKSKMGSYN